MPITNWPKADRPREKLLEKGEQSLTDAELIAILLKVGVRGKTALDLAKELLIQHGDLKQLLSVSTILLLQTTGIGESKCATLKAAIELGRRYQGETLHYGEKLNNPELTQKFLASRLAHYPNEVFACLFMDAHCRLIRFEELFQGTVHHAQIYLREIIRRAMSYNATKLIIAHNHPSGIALPSAQDKEVTFLIKQALDLVDVEMVDHIIVGQLENFSFAEMGLI